MMSGYNNAWPVDWFCGKCRFRNFASRRECKRCSAVRGDQTRNVPFLGDKRNGQRGHRSKTPGPGNRIARTDERHASVAPRIQSMRGSQSFQNLWREGSKDRDMFTTRRVQRRKRENPIGFKELEKMLDKYPEEVVMQLQVESSGFQLMLETPDAIDVDKMFLVMRVLGRATETQSNKESLNILMTKIFQPTFISHLMKFSMSIILENVEVKKLHAYFENLWIVLDTYSLAMPSLAKDQIFVLLGSCIMGIKQISDHELLELLVKYEGTKSYLENEKKKWQPQSCISRKHRERLQDSLQPPENFRELPIIPTVEELFNPHKPFLRRNIVHGKYEDVEHYLDIQFRLLREDFVRPLRIGIQEFKGNVKSHSRDLYIYNNVQIVGRDINNLKVFHSVRLSLPKEFKLENSKRLMHGNLVCFSSDDFKTVLFGSIVDRDPKSLRCGILGIRFDSQIRNVPVQTFTMVESKSFFTAYKHVLRALQKIMEDTFPMEDFIVHVDNNMPPPDYVTRGTQYDLQVIRSKVMMKGSEIYSKLFHWKREDTRAQPCLFPVLRNVHITRELSFWPSCDDLRIDDSQCRALRSALTSKLSIIQGPPGTGKTFLGLKIAQVLLHNSQHWKTEKHKSPILVVCFTNHALDQFLEGMVPFTKNIVRIGSRSKNEVIHQFQINNLVKKLAFSHDMPQSHHQNYNEIKTTLIELESEVRSRRQMLLELRRPTGILKLCELLRHNVIPEGIAQQLESRNLDLTRYLLDHRFANRINGRGAQRPILNKVSRETVANYEAGGDGLQGTDELYAEEEGVWKLDDDFVDYKSTNVTPRLNLSYQISLPVLDNSIQDLLMDREQLYEDERPTAVMDLMWCERRIAELERQYKLLKYGLGVPVALERARNIEKDKMRTITTLSIEDRWSLYRLWIDRLAKKLAHGLVKLEDKFEQNSTVFNEVKDQQYLHIMRHASVVGMTTTGAAQYSDVLHSLQPSIVIIEEAAEILEAHVITSLTHECQHLIMIGDHLQLQPSANVYELATKFGLETSLFERLIKNGIAYESLEYQHRMRPDISRLLVPSIYPNLKDHSSVHEYPHVKGMQKDVFFIDHKQHEDKIGDDNDSKANTHEANLVMALCRHLMLQGYSSDDITVLTPYTGQFFLLKKIQQNYLECKDVRISVVDNFQGEENNIILLSLVRSNEEGKVGFLRTENRVCVALSRAKHGLYVMGNMDQLQESSDLWKKIRDDLVSDDAIGNSVVLKCENHPDVISSVTSYEDILTMSPEGGCRKLCSSSLPKCGHRCPKTCHPIDPQHIKVECPLPCPKFSCERKHQCPQKCWEECNPCVVPVPKTFPCGHTHKVQCSTYDKEHDCTTYVKRVLPHCQHQVFMECHRDPDEFRCTKSCEVRTPCGHKCVRKCHVKEDPAHLKYRCDQPCTRSPDGCSEEHKCQKICYEACGPCIEQIMKKAECGHQHEVDCSKPANEIVCDLNCKRMLPCGHHCKRKCKDPCGGCTVMVDKTILECQHTIKMECGKLPLKVNCHEKCIMKLPCGHSCPEQCKDRCLDECKVLVPSDHKCPKGHAIEVPCYLLNKVTKTEKLWVYCSEPCGVSLDCNHICKGKCGLCLYGRLHIACSEKCGKTLVCGHICKADCSSACPPCQENCPMKCKHSYCPKKCGEPCNPCQEKCPSVCNHQKCKNVCGAKCTQKLCEKPCPKKLKCGHPCVGYCGDTCPPLCRICDKEELTKIIFGYEDEENARFVLLEDCGHVYEATGLQTWLSQKSSEIGMKSCPHCKKPIYNNRRNNEFILDSYKNVSNVNSQYYKKDPEQQKQDIKKLLKDLETLSGEEVEKIRRSLPQISTEYARHSYHAISDNEITMYTFQVQALKKIDLLLTDNSVFTKCLKCYVDFVKKRIMEQKLRISPQMVEEITCELQRMNVLPSYWKLKKLIRLAGEPKEPELMQIKTKLACLMNPTNKFDTDQEAKVKRELKRGEKFVGGLGITVEERLEVLEAMGLKQGHWFKCPNGHIYCIADCGGATVEAKCPECDATIGGGNHTLRKDNALATEMDGARHAAWSNHYDDMRNFRLNE